ncbi:MAG TPA: multidrug effflux MFS transporter [Burkholderiales bacterium]|nr:multidrug effflux MFS transporter [Burkholderiales bacterium]
MNAQQTPLRLTALLGVLIALPALGTDLFVPGLPVLAQALAVEVGAAQFALTTYFAGLAVGMLLWGPLSDRYGRRPVLYIGLATMLGASIAAALVDSVGAVAAARLVQGLAMSSGAVIARAVVRDLHAHEQAARLLASMTIVFSIVPVAAPLAGAAIASEAGWRAIFWCLAGVAALLVVATSAVLRETAPSGRTSARPADIARTFSLILAERRFMRPFLLILCAFLGIIAWVSSSAFVLVRGFGVSTRGYGFSFAAVMLGQITGAWASSRLVVRLGISRLVSFGATSMLVAGVMVALLAWAGVAHWAAVVLPFFLFLVGTALIVPNATAAALSPFPGSAGAAASLMGAVAFTIGALVSAGLGFAFDGTARPMASVAAAAGLAAFFVTQAWKPSTP